MATQWISPTWRMPKNSNQNKFDNYSLEFNGTDEYIDLGSGTTLEITSDFSISVWIKDDSSLNRGIICCGDRNNGSGWHLYRTSTNKVAFNLYTANARTATSTTSINTGNWVNVIATFEYNGTANQQIKIYVNNVFEDDNGWASAQTPSYSGTIYKQIAYPYAGANEFAGNISTPVVFDYLLSSDQRSYLFNSSVTQNPMGISGKPPIVYYPLGGGSTGAANNPVSNTLTVPNDSVPGGAVFDFVPNDYIDCGNPWTGLITPGNNGVQSSFSFWCKIDSGQTSLMGLMDLGGVSSGIRLVLNATTGWKSNLPLMYLGSGAAYVYFNAPTVRDSKWHHWCLTIPTAADPAGYTRVGMELYIDGVALGQDSAAGSPVETWDELAIGKAAFNYADAEITNFQMWNTTLSAPNVTTLYNNGAPLMTGTQPEAANLKGWWKMNVDTSTWDGSNWAIGNSLANYTTALNFPGGTDYIDCTNGFPTTLGASATAVTASGWVKITDLAQQQCLFNITTPGGNYYGSFSIWYHSSSNQLQGYIDGNSNNIKLNSGITDNKWHHLALVYDQSAGATITDGLKLYLDGSLVTPTSSAGSTPASVDFTGLGGMTTRLGWGWSNTYTAVAEMSNVAMWNSALTAGNITTLYNDGTPETTISLSPTSYYKLDNTTTGIQDSGSASNNGTITGSVTQVDSFVSTLTGLSDGMTSANLVTSDLTRSIPYSSYSMTFDGVDDYIDVTQQDLGTVNTVSWWMKREASGAGSDAVFGEDNGTQFWAFIYIDWTANILYYKDPSNNKNTWSTTSFNDTDWHNCIITRDGTTTILYVDGVSLGVGTVPVNPLSGNSKFRYLGADYSDMTREFVGNLSNVAVWTSVLTQDQVLNIYNGGVPNSISSLSPISWWSLAGDSYFDGSNWICPDLGSASNNGTSSGMGGTELVGDGPGSTANGVATSMDIPVNLKGDAPNSTSNAFSINMTAIDRIEYDAEAKAFINAAGITDATQQLAIKTLVSSLQSDNLWTNMKAIYPMVGGTNEDPSPHKYNLKDPQDTDAAFRLTFTGGWTHSATGATPNGTNAGADTYFIPNDQFSSFNEMSFGYYSRDTSDASSEAYDMGVYQASKVVGILIQYLNKFYYSLNQTTYEKPANTHTDGFFVANRSGNLAIEAYRNGSLIDTGTPGSTASGATVSMQVGRFGGGGYFGNKECAFAFIYDGSLDGTQNSNLYNAVQAFNTTLGRQV